MKTKKALKPLFIEDLGQVKGGCGGGTVTTLALGEEGTLPPFDVTTLAVGEEDGFGEVTTLALGEEGGDF
jgi:hypothetical protein